MYNKIINPIFHAKSKNTARLTQTKGFTIIELIVVIAIIAILAAIVIVNVAKYINKSKDASAKQDLSSVITGSAAWYANNGSYGGFLSDKSYTNIASSLSKMGYSIPVGDSGTGVNVSCDSMSGSDCSNTSTKICIAIIAIYETDTNATNSSWHTYCVDSSGIAHDGWNATSDPNHWDGCYSGSCISLP